MYSYLADRKFQVTIDRVTSTRKSIRAGVSQGSVLGPVLFDLYIADIPQPTACKIAQLADDTGLYTYHRQLKTISKTLKADVDKITNYMKTWKIKFNATKTKAILFNKKAKQPAGTTNWWRRNRVDEWHQISRIRLIKNWTWEPTSETWWWDQNNCLPNFTPWSTTTASWAGKTK